MIELDIVYLIDSVLNVKNEMFGEDYAHRNEIIIVKKVIEEELSRNGYPVYFGELDNNEIYYLKDYNKNFMNDIRFTDLLNIIYNRNLIYNIISQIMINKMNKSLSKSCYTCDAIGCLDKSKSIRLCKKWEHDHQSFLQDELDDTKRDIIKEEFNRHYKTRSRIN